MEYTRFEAMEKDGGPAGLEEVLEEMRLTKTFLESRYRPILCACYKSAWHEAERELSISDCWAGQTRFEAVSRMLWEAARPVWLRRNRRSGC